MKRKLTPKETLAVASLLFGLFFGAGNLIFPVHMGQAAGRNSVAASLGFIVTGVGLPLLGVAAMGLSRSESLAELAGQVGKGYGRFFTVLLYLTIGPCFAIPRCATTSFTVGVEPLLSGSGDKIWLLAFSTVFFLLVLFFSLRPSGILTWVGRVINPIFLIFLSTLVVASFVNPMASVSQVAPEGAYDAQPFLTGFLEGYNTMDTLAALAFGITIVQVLRQLGLGRPEDIARETCLSGVFSCLLMALIYALITRMGAQSRGAYPLSANGGIALADIAHHYFGRAGQLILAATVTLACLKTSIGLVTSCAETFSLLYPRVSYKAWTWIFSLFPLAVSNLGLTTIISFSLPVLMFLYPLSITLILLSLLGGLFDRDRRVFVSVTAFTLAAALLDFLAALPEGAKNALHLEKLLIWANTYIPLFPYGLGWILPAAVGLAIGLVLHRRAKSFPSGGAGRA